jgi:hypothetical protein
VFLLRLHLGPARRQLRSPRPPRLITSDVAAEPGSTQCSPTHLQSTMDAPSMSGPSTSLTP